MAARGGFINGDYWKGINTMKYWAVGMVVFRKVERPSERQGCKTLLPLALALDLQPCIRVRTLYYFSAPSPVNIQCWGSTRHDVKIDPVCQCAGVLLFAEGCVQCLCKIHFTEL